MNVPFTISKGADLEGQFLSEATKKGLVRTPLPSLLPTSMDRLVPVAVVTTCITVKTYLVSTGRAPSLLGVRGGGILNYKGWEVQGESIRGRAARS